MTRAERERRTVARYARNILRVHAAAPAKVRNRACDWYEVESDALAALAMELGLPLRAVCGAAAAISPGMRWERVAYHVRRLHQFGAANLPSPIPTYSSAFVDRAERCLRGEDPETVLGGPKVRAFYALLATRGQCDAVVIDGHAFNIARGERTGLRGDVPAAARVTAARYRLAELAYRIAAKALDIPAHAVQAVTWTHWRNA